MVSSDPVHWIAAAPILFGIIYMSKAPMLLAEVRRSMPHNATLLPQT